MVIGGSDDLESLLAHGGAPLAVPSPRIVIDARPQGPNGPLAGETVLGRSVLVHHLELARRLTDQPVFVHARLDDHPQLRSAASNGGVDSAPIVPGSPPENSLILRTDRLYELNRLKRALRRGFQAESAVVWRLDSPSLLKAAEDEFLRRSTYQPFGRYWALSPARALARGLEHSWVRPNHLTLASAISMLSACGLVAFVPKGILVQITIAAALAVGLVLDTADGHLARLQGTASAFGRWIDSVLDELSDLALHARDRLVVLHSRRLGGVARDGHGVCLGEVSVRPGFLDG